MSPEPIAQSPQIPADAPDISNAEKLKARLDYLEDWYFRPQSYETKISQWEVKELRQHRPHLWKDAEEAESDEVRVESVGNGKPSIAIPKQISKASDLARFLHDYFRDKISITIDATRLGLWRKGRSVGEVMLGGNIVIPPPFPNKNKHGNRWNTQECIDWVERWIVPQYRSDGKAQPGSGGAVDFDNFKREHDIWKMQMEKDKENGKFKSVEIFNQHLTAFGLAVNRSLNEGEKMLKKRILEELKGVDASKPELMDDAIGRAVRAAIDALRAGAAKAILDCDEPVGAATNQHE